MHYGCVQSNCVQSSHFQFQHIHNGSNFRTMHSEVMNEKNQVRNQSFTKDVNHLLIKCTDSSDSIDSSKSFDGKMRMKAKALPCSLFARDKRTELFEANTGDPFRKKWNVFFLFCSSSTPNPNYLTYCLIFDIFFFLVVISISGKRISFVVFFSSVPSK